MRHIKVLFAFIFTLSFAALNAQVEEVETTMSLGNQNALVVSLDGADAKVAESVWKEFIKEYGKVKKNKRAKEFYMEQTTIPSVGGKSPCDVYTKFEERAGMVNAYFWVDLGDSFLNSDKHTDAFKGAQTLLKEYNFSVQKHIISKELESARKELGNFEKDLKKLLKDHKGYHKNISDANEKIRKAEINIEKNEVEQINKNDEITSQSTKVAEIEERLRNVGKPAAMKNSKEEKGEAKEDKGEEKDDGGKK